MSDLPISERILHGSTRREIRNELLELFGLACAFRMLNSNGSALPEQLSDAKETGKIIEDRLKVLIQRL